MYCFWLPLYCLSFDVLLLIAPLLSVLRYTASDYPFIVCPSIYCFWLPLYCLSFDILLLIAPKGQTIKGQSEAVYRRTDNKGTIRSSLSKDRQKRGNQKQYIEGHTASDCPFIVCPSIYCFWLPLYCLSFDVLLLIAPLLSVLRYTASDYPHTKKG
jgi:hypothetical protein